MQNRGFARVTGLARGERDFFRGGLRGGAGAETEGENEGEECDDLFHVDNEGGFMCYRLTENKRLSRIRASSVEWSRKAGTLSSFPLR